MQSRITKEIVLDALLMAVWRRNPTSTVTVHSDQGSQYTSHDWQSFLKTHGLEGSMSSRGNCHDNAVAESFFAAFKKRVTQEKIYSTRDDAKTEIFNFIDMFYNPIKRHSHTGGVSPAQFEEGYFSRLESV
jgi:putative transposase